ncbi:hypothetical protein KZ810_08010 [Sphingomonas sp. RHCKR47]|uniref:head-tail joining protein n=1 Tax=Sphingomonas citricola TaxID=2862498 RepID=UPI001CA4BB0E|nr:hypothetical protein [Sphingomonas citricola]MBW6523441.1 hypothetical protein [Sphingomonas citricola]
MSDPFAAALDALFNAPGTAAAVYQPDYGEPVAIRVIISSLEDDASYGGGQRTRMRGTVLEIRRSDAPRIRPGEIVAIGGSIADGQLVGGDPVLRISGDPRGDVEGLTWFCGTEPLDE